MSVYAAGYRGLGADAVVITGSAPPLPDWLQAATAPPSQDTPAMRAAYANYLKLAADIPVDRGPAGPPLSYEAWLRAQYVVTYSPIGPAPTPSVVAEKPGQRVGQRFSLQSIPWWGWALAALAGWKLLGRRR